MSPLWQACEFVFGKLEVFKDSLFSSLGDIIVISKADERHHLDLLRHIQEMSITDVITGTKNLEQKHICAEKVSFPYLCLRLL